MKDIRCHTTVRGTLIIDTLIVLLLLYSNKGKKSTSLTPKFSIN